MPAWSGRGRQPTDREQVKVGEPGTQTVAAVAAQWLPTQWRTLTVAEGAREGPRTYQFGARCGSGKAGTGCQGGKVGCWFAATGTAVNWSTIRQC